MFFTQNWRSARVISVPAPIPSIMSVTFFVHPGICRSFPAFIHYTLEEKHSVFSLPSGSVPSFSRRTIHSPDLWNAYSNETHGINGLLRHQKSGTKNLSLFPSACSAESVPDLLRNHLSQSEINGRILFRNKIDCADFIQLFFGSLTRKEILHKLIR